MSSIATAEQLGERARERASPGEVHRAAERHARLKRERGEGAHEQADGGKREGPDQRATVDELDPPEPPSHRGGDRVAKPEDREADRGCHQPLRPAHELGEREGEQRRGVPGGRVDPKVLVRVRDRREHLHDHSVHGRRTAPQKLGDPRVRHQRPRDGQRPHLVRQDPENAERDEGKEYVHHRAANVGRSKARHVHRQLVQAGFERFVARHDRLAERDPVPSRAWLLVGEQLGHGPVELDHVRLHVLSGLGPGSVGELIEPRLQRQEALTQAPDRIGPPA